MLFLQRDWICGCIFESGTYQHQGDYGIQNREEYIWKTNTGKLLQTRLILSVPVLNYDSLTVIPRVVLFAPEK
jgi:hypothetical protein